MAKQAIKPFEFWKETMDMMTKHGLLLCSVGADGKPNIMAIGWMTSLPKRSTIAERFRVATRTSFPKLRR